MGILIGEKNFRNKGYSSTALTMCMKYLNNKYKIRYFWLGVNKKNLPAIESYKKAGFRIFREKNKDYKMLRDYNLLNLNRFSLGSAQFGMDYGINNYLGKTKFKEIKKIINFSQKIGIRSIDTAIAYGDAEKTLGKIGMKNFKVTSKLPYISENKLNDLEKIVKKSLKNLNIKKLNCLLIHSTKNLNNNTKAIFQKMKILKSKGLVTKIGISFTSTKNLYKILNRFNIDVIQLPYNIVDRRIHSKKVIELLKTKKIELQTRSIFLQGLLFKKYSNIPFNIRKRSKHLLKMKSFLSRTKKNKLSKMLNFVYNNNLPENFIIGVDNFKQILEISKVKKENYSKFDDLSTYDEKLINPSLWY